MQALRRWRVLLVLKPSDVYPPRAAPGLGGPLSSPASSPHPSRVVNPRVRDLGGSLFSFWIMMAVIDVGISVLCESAS